MQKKEKIATIKKDMKIEWKKSALGEWVAVLDSGEIVRITPRAFGSNKYRVRGNAAVGEALFSRQFYDTLKDAKGAVKKVLDNKYVV